MCPALRWMHDVSLQESNASVAGWNLPTSSFCRICSVVLGMALDYLPSLHLTPLVHCSSVRLGVASGTVRFETGVHIQPLELPRM